MLTQAELQSVLHYDPATGIFTWTASLSRKTIIGSIAGSRHSKKYPYIAIRIKGKLYKAHRLAALYVNGEWPENLMDHVNGILSDNRWSNLRKATSAENAQNKKKSKINTSGHKGIVWRERGNVWEVSIGKSRDRFYCGSFKNIDEAIAAARAVRQKLHGEYACDR